MSTPYLLSDTSLAVVIDGAPQIIPVSHPSFKEILELVTDPVSSVLDIQALLDIGKSIETFTSGRISAANRVVNYDGHPLNTSLTRRIIQLMEEGKDDLISPLVAFLDRVMQNPSHRAVNGLFDWVSKSGMPITEEGMILAWKIVAENYMDYYSGTLDHSPGNVVTLPRNMCDENPDQTCSNGIHFCSFEYLPKYYNGTESRRVMLVSIDPADVVAIPKEYDVAKGRCCKMTVIREVPKEKLEGFFPSREIYNIQPEFEVGQVWKTRDGELVTIVDTDADDHPTKPIKGDDGFYRDDDGEWNPGYEDGDDLVEFISHS
jgi:hypothetical protein